MRNDSVKPTVAAAPGPNFPTKNIYNGKYRLHTHFQYHGNGQHEYGFAYAALGKILVFALQCFPEIGGNSFLNSCIVCCCHLLCAGRVKGTQAKFFEKCYLENRISGCKFTLSMKLIVITSENTVPEEASLVNQLFQLGLDRLHLRKKILVAINTMLTCNKLIRSIIIVLQCTSSSTWCLPIIHWGCIARTMCCTIKHR